MLDLTDLFNWAFERHQNVLSWYIRPLFLIPFCIFAYRRSVLGMVVTLLALVTSMAWFPVPRHPDPQVISFLEAEKAFLLSPFTLKKAALLATVVVSMSVLALAFWHRSLKAGIGVLVLIALGKILWSVNEDAGGQAIVVPALLGLVVCIALLTVYMKRRYPHL